MALILSGAALVLVSGCASARLTASIQPGTSLAKFQSFYVLRHEKDTRDVHGVIRDELAKRGLVATAGPDSTRPQQVDVVVTYVDRWMWDLTMYLLSLNIQFRHPETHTLLASGHSYRTSLVRKEPAEMASEILDEIFKQSQ